MKLERLGEFATTRRLLKLVNAFRFEQTNPDMFYSLLAKDSASMVTQIIADQNLKPNGLTLLDVGGGDSNSFYATEFTAKGLTYIGTDDLGQSLTTKTNNTDNSNAIFIQSNGETLPFVSDSFDIVFSSNVAEHTSNPWSLANEMLRVLKPNGVMIFSYTTWLSPHGGHETGMWHYFGGKYAAKLYHKKHGYNPKNLYGTSLFPVYVKDGLAWAKTQPHYSFTFPRYHPKFLWFLGRIPIVREFLTENLVIVIKK